MAAHASVRASLPTIGLRAGIRDVDFLIHQIVFMRAAMDDAKRREFVGLAALEWVEFLSWPECLARAGATWRRQLRRRYAFEEQTALWQGVLRCRFEGDSFPLGPPRSKAEDRNGIYPPPVLFLGPYPSEYSPTKLAPATLHVSITYAPWAQPSVLQPIRRLTDGFVWTLQVSATSVYDDGFRGFLELTLDEPRGYVGEDVKRTFIAMADQLEAWLGQTQHTLEQATAYRTKIAATRIAAESLNSARASLAAPFSGHS